MTRYTRLGKPTHQRIPGEATNWEDLKSTPQKDKNSSKKGREKREFSRRPDSSGGGSGSRGTRGFKRTREDPEVSSNFTELGTRIKEGEAATVASSSDTRKVKGTATAGYGKSKVVQIFGQFWVPADDAKRLQELVKKLRDEGLSRKEILAALQTERRRAEKAAKRIRDKTCFGCRQFGHVLSDCPNTTGTNRPNGTETKDSLIGPQPHGDICFKCGSTEHTSRTCKKKGEKFNFAKCFICNKVGHISRQCPDNTRGIYPGGGECNICKELTHLAKDCPSGVNGKLGGGSGLGGQRKDQQVGGELNLPVIPKLSNPFASTEYEPETSFQVSAPSKPKKRRVKF